MHFIRYHYNNQLNIHLSNVHKCQQLDVSRTIMHAEGCICDRAQAAKYRVRCVRIIMKKSNYFLCTCKMRDLQSQIDILN